MTENLRDAWAHISEDDARKLLSWAVFIELKLSTDDQGRLAKPFITIPKLRNTIKDDLHLPSGIAMSGPTTGRYSALRKHIHPELE